MTRVTKAVVTPAVTLSPITNIIMQKGTVGQSLSVTTSKNDCIADKIATLHSSDVPSIWFLLELHLDCLQDRWDLRPCLGNLVQCDCWCRYCFCYSFHCISISAFVCLTVAYTHFVILHFFIIKQLEFSLFYQFIFHDIISHSYAFLSLISYIIYPLELG